MAMDDSRPPVDRNLSYGRGGAGNMAPRSPSLVPTDLSTPTIKSKTFTTGRGGTGNMSSNADLARTAQDVDGPVYAGVRDLDAGFQYGRGGAGNTVFLSDGKRRGSEAGKARRGSEVEGKVGMLKEEKDRREEQQRGKSVAERGMGMLNRIRNKTPEGKK